jgi:hypothetical protein
MKVVCCKNCGAKYQLDDNDDVSTFECSSCAGELEYLEEYSDNDNKSHSSFMDSLKPDNSYIVQCEDCGLKYKIRSSDNILDYECDSCGGSLRYLDDDMNKELDNYLKERKQEAEKYRKQTNSTTPTSEEPETEDNKPSLKSITNKIENFFSEEHMLEIADTEKKEEELDSELTGKTARTTIPQAVLSKFGKEFAVPKTNDYNILKNFLKDEFLKGMNEYYIDQPQEKTSDNSLGGFLDKLAIKEPDTNIIKTENNEKDDDGIDLQEDLDTNASITILGAAVFVISVIEILLINSGIGIAALFAGVIMLCYGLYRSHDVKETEERTRIIREHLLTLPEEYYVFYNVKTPTSSSSINHLVVGPTGIYALISQKYNPKLRLDSENENLNLIGSSELEDDKIEEFTTSQNMKKFRYTTKQAKFSQDNKVKQKALSLGEDLINLPSKNLTITLSKLKTVLRMMITI